MDIIQKQFDRLDLNIYLEELDKANNEAFETYDNLSVKNKIELLDDSANGMGWFYSTNKEREFTCDQLLKQEAMNFYIKHLKKLKETVK